MTQNGIQTSFYLQKDIEEKLEKIVKNNKEIYKSRNHAINCAVIYLIRKHKNMKGGKTGKQTI